MLYSVFSGILVSIFAAVSASTISGTQTAKYWLSAGGSHSTCPTAVAVAYAESSLDCAATGYNPSSYDRGLWQINSYWHSEVSDSCAYSCSCCATAAYDISSHGSNWTPWSTYNSGAYKNYMSKATTDCNSA